MQQQRPAAQGERSLGELFGDLARELTTLVRKELALAKTEFSEKVSNIGRDIALLAAGGAVAYAGFLALLAAIILALGELGVPWWLSALLVGIVVGGVGYMLVQRGLSALRQESLAPQKTIETLRDDAQLIKERSR